MTNIVLLQDKDMKLFTLFAVMVSTLCAACVATEGRRVYYSPSQDCEAILSDPWAGPTSLPPGCVRRGR